MDKISHISPSEKREHFSSGTLAIREDGEKGNIIEGVAIVTDQETVLYEDADYREIEVIDQSCINPDVIAQQDMTLNLLHNRDESFARTPNSLRVESREDGLHFEADIPDCDLGKRAKALTANGTYAGCSFEFWPKDYQVTQREAADGKTEYIIRHTAFERIAALTLAINPAYPTTSVGIRELYREMNEPQETDEEKAERERQEAEAAEAAKREQELKEAQEREAKIANARRRSARRHMMNM